MKKVSVLMAMLLVSCCVFGQKFVEIGSSNIFFTKQINSKSWRCFIKDSVALFVKEKHTKSFEELFRNDAAAFDSIFATRQAGISNNYKGWINDQGVKSIAFKVAIAVFDLKEERKGSEITWLITYRGLEEDCFMKLILLQRSDGRLQIKNAIPADCEI